MTDDVYVTEEVPPPKPSLRARLSILAIGGIALLGIAAMCIIFVILAANR